METAPTGNACRDQEIAPTGNACRDLEIAPTVDAGISIALAIHSFDGRDLKIAGISIALTICSLDPTKDAIFDSAEYKLGTSVPHLIR